MRRNPSFSVAKLSVSEDSVRIILKSFNTPRLSISILLLTVHLNSLANGSNRFLLANRQKMALARAFLYDRSFQLVLNKLPVAYRGNTLMSSTPF